MEIFKHLCPEYEISNEGRLRVRGEIRPIPIGPRGYAILEVKLGFHRAVAFLFNAPPGHPTNVIDHIDQNPLNNRADNLRWVSKRENWLNSDKRELQTREVQRDRRAVERLEAAVQARQMKLKEELDEQLRLRNAKRELAKALLEEKAIIRANRLAEAAAKAASRIPKNPPMTPYLVVTQDSRMRVTVGVVGRRKIKIGSTQNPDLAAQMLKHARQVRLGFPPSSPVASIRKVEDRMLALLAKYPQPPPSIDDLL